MHRSRRGAPLVTEQCAIRRATTVLIWLFRLEEAVSLFALIVQLFQKKKRKRKKDANYISDVRSSFKNTRSRDSASPRAAGVEDRHSETAGIQTWFIHDAAAFGGCWGSLLLGLTPQQQLSLHHRGRVETSSSSLQVELAFIHGYHQGSEVWIKSSSRCSKGHYSFKIIFQERPLRPPGGVFSVFTSVMMWLHSPSAADLIGALIQSKPRSSGVHQTHQRPKRRNMSHVCCCRRRRLTESHFHLSGFQTP